MNEKQAREALDLYGELRRLDDMVNSMTEHNIRHVTFMLFSFHGQMPETYKPDVCMKAISDLVRQDIAYRRELTAAKIRSLGFEA